VRTLESDGFRLLKEKGSIRYYRKAGHKNLIRVDFHGGKEVPTDTCHAILKAAGIQPEARKMIDLRSSLVIEATEEPDFFSFYSPDLEGFSGVGHSVEDCLYKAKWGMADHVSLLEEQGLPVPLPNSFPRRLDHSVNRRVFSATDEHR
jgi:predicted RNA binding protein YcfA (HicA-like mRNA interferase family)/predicted RNase H-like HicB family nuclease